MERMNARLGCLSSLVTILIKKKKKILAQVTRCICYFNSEIISPVLGAVLEQRPRRSVGL